MKNKELITLCLAWLPAAGILHAQQSAVCANPNAYTTIHANNIKAGLLNAGDLFWDFNNAQFFPNPTPNGPNPATIFAAGLWIGGINPAGNLDLATSTFRSNGATDYWAGPLSTDGMTEATVCENWDRFFHVKGADIKSFLDELPDLVNNPGAALANYKSIMGWPAFGNPYFADAWGFDLPFTPGGLAAFYDDDNDGQYDPLKGDYPVVKLQGKPAFVPEEIVWCVFNDQGGGAVHTASQGSPLQVEVQLTVWAFNDPGNPVLNNTLFTAHRIINRNTELLDSCFLAIWVDFDLGCYADDYIGSAPGLDAFYAYNQDALDGSPGTTCDGGIPTFGDNPPVQSVTFLSRSMDKFIYYNNPGVGSQFAATTDPDLPVEYYRYLTGSWRDGSPLTYGGSGYQSGATPVDYAFPTLPNDLNGWNMCNANLSYGDRRALGIHKIGQLPPGQIEEMVTAWAVHYDLDLPCDLGSTIDDITEIHDLHNFFDDGFAGVASPLTSIPEITDAAIGIFPNPAVQKVTLAYGGLSIREIRIFAPDGRCVQTLKNIRPEQTVLNVSEWSSGVYTIQMLTESGVAVKKISVLK